VFSSSLNVFSSFVAFLVDLATFASRELRTSTDMKTAESRKHGHFFTKIAYFFLDFILIAKFLLFYVQGEVCQLHLGA
jgi:hypothetical protein